MTHFVAHEDNSTRRQNAEMNNEAALILRCDFLKLVASLNMSAIVTSSASLIDKECLRKKWAKEHRMKMVSEQSGLHRGSIRVCLRVVSSFLYFVSAVGVGTTVKSFYYDKKYHAKKYHDKTISYHDEDTMLS